MKNIKHIVVPTDFSLASKKALDYTHLLVDADPSVKVTLLHISGEALNDTDRQQVASRLQTLLQEYIPESISTNYEIRSGDLTRTLMDVAAELKTDLIVMGTKGSEEIEETAVSNTSRLVLEADSPVLVIPENSKNFAVKNIALALSKKEMDDSFALGVLWDLARTFDAKVHVLTIQGPQDVEIPVQPENESILEYYLESLDHLYVFPKHSDIEKGISDYVKDKKIDLLAILPRNHARKSMPSEGRLTKLLTLHTQVPLLTID